MRLYRLLALLPVLWLAACAPAITHTVAETPPVVQPSPSALPVTVQADTDTDDLPSDTDNDTVADDAPVIPDEPVYPFGLPNEIGNIMIVMYHGLSEKNPPYDRRTEDFVNDLQTFYAQGYRLVSVNDLIDQHITVAAGFTPLALTFDDSKSTAFSLIEVDGVLMHKPGCIVDILESFYAEHPDFGKAATFYINGKDPFSGAGTIAQRLNYLIDNGYELGNHTWSHADLSKQNAAGIQEEIGRVDRLIKENCPDYVPRSLTYPQGKRPKESLRAYALAGEYDGAVYTHGWAIREGQSTVTANPFHTSFDPINVPRVRASDDSTPEYDVQDLGYFLRYYANHPDKRYISDGDPDRLTVPENLSHLVNPDALGGLALDITP